jgi:hypothetical protein
MLVHVRFDVAVPSRRTAGELQATASAHEKAAALSSRQF